MNYSKTKSKLNVFLNKIVVFPIMKIKSNGGNTWDLIYEEEFG
jgi:hypothetical protein